MPLSRPILLSALLVGVLSIWGVVAVWLRSPTSGSARQPAAVSPAKRHAEQLASLRGDSVPELAAAVAALRRATPPARFTDPAHADVLFQAGRLLADQGRCDPAAWCLEHALRVAPAHRPARSRLALLRYVTGDYHGAQDHWRVLLREGGMDLISLPLLGNRRLRWAYEDRALEAGHAADPHDPLVLQGLGHWAFIEKDLEGSERYLRAALTIDPALQPAAIRLAQLLYESGRRAELIRWLDELDSRLLQHPEIWLLRGHFCRANQDASGAARCYWEAFQRDPLHQVANEQLAQSLFALEQDEAAQRLAERGNHLRTYAATCRIIHLKDAIHLPDLRAAADSARHCGCDLDAAAWCSAALAVDPQQRWAIVMRRGLSDAQLAAGGARCAGLQDERAAIGLSSLSVPPLPAMAQSPAVAQSSDGRPGQRVGGESAAADPNSSPIRFTDATASAGIHFVYADGADPEAQTTRLFEFTGGGTAALDFDRDGRCDLFFVQGGAAPSLGTSSAAVVSRPSDQLYRNLGEGRFAGCEAAAGVADRQYGQGVSVGDYDSDGFADLYVANIGENVLYRNNGDGSFRKIAIGAVGGGAPAWTTSCLMADLNEDGLPDLYDVCYAPNDMIHLRMCRSGVASVPCDGAHPLRAGQDRLLINLGDGRFEDRTAASGIESDAGIGLGVVAADFTGNGRIDLFVANDARQNFLFVNEAPAGQSPRYREQAVLRGLAYSGQGVAQACMGVAADDFSDDGRLDLFITNFYADYNTLYVRHEGGLYEDATQRAGLQAVSWLHLGFGTQSLDADLDGLPDLILANGDVVDFSTHTPGRLYAQPLQFLHNRGGGHFTEMNGRTLGPAFDRAAIGRSLVRVDFNNDGREDVAISNLRSPARLLSNTTDTSAHYLDVRLVGTRSNRDAIGTSVTVTTERRSWTKSFTAGDGYMASNQSGRVFGLGDSEQITEVLVRWPGGTEQRIVAPPLDSRLLIIEGLEQGFILN
ncbi:CRTAC1 family protein [Roseimaritima sediminicola]|uniref:CRTAC1 family protein n=1 Tax=Roseimaritima sediminicola TaxID=2662066 RepID=UPI00129847C5|nr:CRTAC1 family protein [Roseimaritima sediminicola]